MDDASPPMPPVRIRLLALPEASPSILYCLHEVFAAVGRLWPEITGEETAVRHMEPLIVARDGAPFTSPVGLPVVPHAGLEEAGGADIVIVTDLTLPQEVSPRGRWAAETAWARAQFAQGATVCSVCTGTVFLAEAGLLDGVEATSHWGVKRLIEEQYPHVKLHADRILCPAGADHRIITSGGAGTWAELALYLIARFCSPQEAVRMAKVFVLGDHSEGLLPFAAMSRVADHADRVIGRCQEWLADHYGKANPVARMTALSGLPERTFKRRFKAATGYTPIDYVQSLRIEEAKQMLETTDEPTDAVAHAVGYDDPAFFRRLFKRATGVTPARYRQRYRFVGLAAESRRYRSRVGPGAGEKTVPPAA